MRVLTGRIVAVGVLAGLVGSFALGGGVAFARMPWWRVSVLSAPAVQAGEEGLVLLEASDLGDAPVDGQKYPVLFTGVFPAGVTPKRAVEEGGGSSPIGIKGVNTISKCTIEGHAVFCSYAGPLLAYERLIVAVRVSVEAGAGTGPVSVAVSGGGATPLSTERQLGMSGPPGFGVQDYELIPEAEGGGLETQAGAHPFQLTSTLLFNVRAPLVSHPNIAKSEPAPEAQPVTLTKDLRFTLPAGLVGNPTPLPKCPLSVFVKQANLCPNSTAIGVATPIVDNTSPGFTQVPLAETVPVYNVEPSVGEPARFGFSTQAGPVVLDTSIRTGNDYAVVVTVPDIPSDIPFIGSQVTFWGVPADPRHDTSRGSCLDQFKGSFPELSSLEEACPAQEKPQPFLDLPTSCETQAPVTTVEGDAWEHPGDYRAVRQYTFGDTFGRPLPLDGCDALSFDPSIVVSPDAQKGAIPTGLTVGVHVDQQASLDPTGLAEATVRNTMVTLPQGVALNPAGADGLTSCSPVQVGLNSPGEQECPESSKIATAEIETPLLPNKLEGAAYLATQEDNPFGTVIAVYIVVHDPVSGVRVKLAGKVETLPNGQIVSTFDNTPPLPFENLRLKFFGGSRAPLATPTLCGSYETSAQIAPWTGKPASQLLSPPFEITTGPDGTPATCQNPLMFNPSLAAGSLNLQAGGFTPFTTTMSREDGNQNLSALSLHMPPGLSGLLGGVELCPEPQASQGLCGPNSLIGETTVSVGLGSNPYSVKGGKVYLTGPYEGAPFGLSIVNPAKAGPFDLEKTKSNHPACDCLVVRAKIEVDPTTAALTVSSDTSGPHAIPTILEGIPLQVKHVNVTIDRPGFMFNPTDCEPTRITGSLTSAEDATSALSVPFQVTNCATLGFKPFFDVTTSAHTSREKGASLDTKVTYPVGSLGKLANIKSVKVDLPYQLPSRLTTLQKACTDKQFEVNPATCPVPSRVGAAVVHTPLLPVPLEGPAYFVSHGAAKFPELIVVLQGYGVTIDLHGETFISKKGITSTTFHALPDAPFESFELSLPQGPFSALTNNGNLCTAGQTVTVKKRVKSRVHGHLTTVTVKVKKKGPGMLMPTALTAQNGDVIHQNTPIHVLGCAKQKVKKGRRAAHHKGKGK